MYRCLQADYGGRLRQTPATSWMARGYGRRCGGRRHARRYRLRLRQGARHSLLGVLPECAGKAGADEFVLGFLTPDGAPDLVAVERLIAVLDGARWTFHRAIDRTADRDGLRKRLADLPGLDTYLTAGSATGVDDGLATLKAEAARAGEPGYEPQILVGGGLRLDHLPELRAAGLDAFHIGGAARPQGWAAPVSADAVRAWREAVDA